jgi:hypothetical protein
MYLNWYLVFDENKFFDSKDTDSHQSIKSFKTRIRASFLQLI